ncbi:hypothetical protein TELCIR_10500 [Teladorsagia circumcincta]|uniref:Uncharacterized protein n=1 Tax=Teladorsagia circumcincta TaxID=45464 RepID=A0A2G9UC31_TELCI|nr:hypothetical protein TELCIR_10500 [Teladorsagia circumcincta]
MIHSNLESDVNYDIPRNTTPDTRPRLQDELVINTNPFGKPNQVCIPHQEHRVYLTSCPLSLLGDETPASPVTLP